MTNRMCTFPLVRRGRLVSPRVVSTAAVFTSEKIFAITKVSLTGGRDLDGVSSSTMVVLWRCDALEEKMPLKTRLTCRDSERESTDTIAVPPPGSRGPSPNGRGGCKQKYRNKWWITDVTFSITRL